MKKNEIHLWRVKLDRPEEDLQHYRPLLSPNEIQRADRFVQDKDRNRFLVGRGALRSILSTYTHLKPQELKFEYGPKDKPVLAESHADQRVSFNLSHCNDLALIAVADRARRVGVDLEMLRELQQLQRILKRYFSKNEQAEYEALPAHEKKRAFFNLWSRKEAFVKAWGESIVAMDLHQLEVTLTPDTPAQIRTVPEAFAASQNWFIQDLEVGSEYSGCIVAERLSPDEELAVRQYRFDSEFLI